jgi:hypothetical protein
MSKAAEPPPPAAATPAAKPYQAPFPLLVMAFLFCLSILPLVVAFMIGVLELFAWLHPGGWYLPFIRALLCHAYMIAMPFMIQALAVKKDFDPRQRAYSYIIWGFYWGAFLGCVALFSYYSHKQFVLHPEVYAGHAGPGFRPWVLYSLNNFFDAILLGAPSTFQLELSDIHPQTFWLQLSLYLFRLMTVAGLLQTAAIIWKRRRGGKVSEDEIHALAKKFRDDM